MADPKEPEHWDYGFTFLCPNCDTWTSYAERRAQPVRFTRWVKLGRNPDEIAAILVCEDCGQEVSCVIAEVP